MLLGTRLRELRKQQQTSMKAVAQKIGVSFQQVSKWETDKSRPEYENLVALADFYDVTTDYLLGREK